MGVLGSVERLTLLERLKIKLCALVGYAHNYVYVPVPEPFSSSERRRLTQKAGNEDSCHLFSLLLNKAVEESTIETSSERRRYRKKKAEEDRKRKR